MTGFNFTPRRVRLNLQSVTGDFFHHFKIFFGLQRAPVNADIKSLGDEKVGLLKSAIKRMHNAPSRHEMSVLDNDLSEILMTVPVMQKHGQLEMRSELELFLKVCFLGGLVAEVQSVIV